MPATLQIRVQPRASCSEITGWQEEALRVRLTAPPVEGAANKALIQFLADTLGVRKGDITLVSGDHSRNKCVRFESLTPEELRRMLVAVAPRGE